MLFDNIRLYDKDGNPITIRYVCNNCGHEMKIPYLITYPNNHCEPYIFHCKKCSENK